MKSTSKHRTLKKVFLNVTACLTALVVTGSIIANECEVQLNSFLGTSSTKIVTNLPDGVTEEGYVRYYDSKYSTLAELKAAGNAKVREVEGEGIVLMKNENSVLPLAAGAKVSLVGVTAMDPVYGGTGSGAVDADGAPNYLDVLTGAGFDVVDKPLLNWYVSEEKKRNGHEIGEVKWKQVKKNHDDTLGQGEDVVYVIGRVGGDEFIIYILGGCSQEAVDGRAAQLAERLRKAGRRYGMQWNLSFTLGLAEKQAGDDYISLFDRADQMLLARKKARRARRADSADAGGERSICTDMALIRRELREKDPPKGAFCQDYETFKQIYRFVERGLKRSGQSAYIILMTLTDAQGQFVPLAAREEYMSRLSDDLQASLRSGDLFAPYSGCQYLLMVLGASSENAAVIAGRIHTRFMSRVAPDAGLLLRYDVYPMGELPLQPKG